MAPKFKDSSTAVDMQPNAQGVWADPADNSPTRVPFVKSGEPHASRTPAEPFLARMARNRPISFVAAAGLVGFATVLAVEAIPGVHPAQAHIGKPRHSLVGSQTVPGFDLLPEHQNHAVPLGTPKPTRIPPSGKMPKHLRVGQQAT